MIDEQQKILVLDIGKTHLKLKVVNAALNAVVELQAKNKIITTEPYPSVDVEGIWSWVCQTLTAWKVTPTITDIVVTTHGATAALINRESDSNEGLVLPILDYEYSGIEQCSVEYKNDCPPFAESLSPALPAGLNLGKQLYWLNKRFPEKFKQATDILMYPQYWVWRLSGVCTNEVTSLGCHTDMWDHQQQDFSSLVDKMRWRPLLGELRNAWDVAGTIKPAVSAQTGLSKQCKVHVGVHDSNAGLIRYLQHNTNAPCSVISTGTWTILMALNTPDIRLQADKDMLANINILEQKVPCARFMGGREYERICEELGQGLVQEYSAEALNFVVAHQLMVTPDFSGGNGPFANHLPRTMVDTPTPYAQLIATIYCALLIDHQLSMLSATGDIYIEGAFLKNRLLCQLVAQLRPLQSIYLSTDDTGTVQGAAMLAQWPQTKAQLTMQQCEASKVNGLMAYKQRWLTEIQN